MKSITIIIKTSIILSLFCAFYSYAYTSSEIYVESRMDVSCTPTASTFFNHSLAFKMRKVTMITEDPTSPSGQGVDTELFEGNMSLSGYENGPGPMNTVWKFSKKDEDNTFFINELKEKEYRSISINAYVPEDKGYSIELNLLSDRFDRAKNVWSPEDDVYAFVDAPTTGNEVMLGTLTIKKKNQILGDYSWKGLVSCSLRWENVATIVEHESDY